MKSKREGNRGKLYGEINSNNYNLGGVGEGNGSANRIGERYREDNGNRKNGKKKKGGEGEKRKEE